MTVLASDGLGAGLIGFLVVLGLIVASVLLFMSMQRHLRKVPSDFDKPPEERPAAGQPDGETPHPPRPPEQRDKH